MAKIKFGVNFIDKYFEDQTENKVYLLSEQNSFIRYSFLYGLIEQNLMLNYECIYFISDDNSLEKMMIKNKINALSKYDKMNIIETLPIVKKLANKKAFMKYLSEK